MIMTFFIFKHIILMKLKMRKNIAKGERMMMMININSREEIFYTTLGRRKLNKCLIDMKNIHISRLSSQKS